MHLRWRCQRWRRRWFWASADKHVPKIPKLLADEPNLCGSYEWSTLEAGKFERQLAKSRIQSNQIVSSKPIQLHRRTRITERTCMYQEDINNQDITEAEVNRAWTATKDQCTYKTAKVRPYWRRDMKWYEGPQLINQFMKEMVDVPCPDQSAARSKEYPPVEKKKRFPFR